MSPEQENFEALRRLLAFKRHEQPPPGYFNGFSRQVIARIQAGEAAAAESWIQRLRSALGFQNAWMGLEAKPLVAGAFGLGVCSLLVVGLVSSERVDANAAGNLTVDNSGSQAVFATVPRQTIGSTVFERAALDHGFTSEVFTTRSSIFDEIQKPHVQPANFSVPSN